MIILIYWYNELDAYVLGTMSLKENMKYKNLYQNHLYLQHYIGVYFVVGSILITHRQIKISRHLIQKLGL